MLRDKNKPRNVYGYCAFNYSPSPLHGAGPVCLVVVVKRLGLKGEDIGIYLLADGRDIIDESHYEYIRAMAEDWNQVAALLEVSNGHNGARELSIGPLRAGLRGVCSSDDLPVLLRSLFCPNDYVLQSNRRVVPIRPSLCGGDSDPE